METIETIENTLWFLTNWRINILIPHSTLYWYSHQIRLVWPPDDFMRWRVTEKTFFYSSVSCRPIHLFLDYVATIQQVVVVVAVEGDYIHTCGL